MMKFLINLDKAPKILFKNIFIFALILLLFFAPYFGTRIALADIETLRPGTGTDNASQTTNDANSFDASGNTTQSTTARDQNADPSFTWFNFGSGSGGTTNSQTLQVYYESSTAGDANDTFSIVYGTNFDTGTCNNGTFSGTLVSSTASSHANNTLATADLGTGQDLTTVCVKLLTSKVTKGDGSSVFIEDVQVERDFTPAAGVDLSWDNTTATASFSIWAGSTPATDAVLTWANGTKICERALSDDNNQLHACGTLNKSQKYRVQMILKNVGGEASMSGSGDPVDQKNVKAHWAGSNPTIAASSDCGFRDFDADNTSATCNVAFNGNDVRITNTGTTVLIAATTGTEGFMYLITTDTDIPLSDPSTYASASIDTITEDSSKISIGLKRAAGNFIRGLVKIRGKVKFR